MTLGYMIGCSWWVAMSIRNGRLSRIRTITLIAALSAMGSVASGHADATYIEFDVSAASETYPVSINAVNDIGGFYKHSGTPHGFLRTHDGTITRFDPRGSRETWVRGMNSSDTIVGYFANPNGFYRGFLRSADGAITPFNVQYALSTFAYTINSVGVTAGYYFNDDSLTCHGFIRAVDGATASFDAPGAVCTLAVSINKQGVIAGIWLDGAYNQHGFTRNPDGTLIEFDVPRSLSTAPQAIDNSGAIAGPYTDRHGETHSFLRAPNGKITKFDAPESTDTYATDLAYQRGSGSHTTGYFHDGSQSGGFLRLTDGTVLTFHVPGDSETDPASINAHDWITGSYLDVNNITHGFLRIP